MGILAPGLVVVTAITIITLLSMRAPQPGVQTLFRRLLLGIAITSSLLLLVSVASFLYLEQHNADSPAGAIPMVMAILCSVIAVPAWIGFAIQARRRRA